MKLRFILFAAMLAAGPEISAMEGENPIPQQGVLDLRDQPLSDETLIKLNGEWIFFWKQLLPPGSVPSGEGSGIMVTVPSYWTGYTVEGQKLPGTGYGTYALRVLLPEGYRASLCFDIPVFDAAYRFYVNDILAGSNGEVGTSGEEEEPWYDPSGFCFRPGSDTLQILIQVSNFHHRRGGFWLPMNMGGAEKVQKRQEKARIFYYSTIGILFFVILFFLIFWFFSRRTRIMLLFALTALGVLIRSAHTGLFLSATFLDIPWTLQIRLEYLGTYLAYIFGVQFLHQLFPARYMQWPVKINSWLFALLCLSVVVLPVRLFTYSILLFQPLVLVFLAHFLVRSLAGAFRRRWMDGLFFFSLAFFIVTLVNDIMLANSAGAASADYLSMFSFQVFVYLMAVMIIMQWVSNYNERLQLESTLRFKNKLLAVIAHDLKNPVASMVQFSEILSETPELARDVEVTSSLKESSQAAISLLDNMLYWSKSQTEEIRVHMVEVELKELVGEVIALHQHMARQKKIDLRPDIPSGLSIRADRALITIVWRNLVSNAVKFTPKGGTVRLEARQEDDRVRCMVSDTGVGIQPEILERFRNTGSMETTEGTDFEIGTGLGLQLVRDMIIKNGGSLEVESTPGRGTTFSFLLPSAKTVQHDHFQAE